jgi:hypothetical protein
VGGPLGDPRLAACDLHSRDGNDFDLALRWVGVVDWPEHLLGDASRRYAVLVNSVAYREI